jgi:tetratricopeptide (TPR) repeat protein
MLSRLSQKNSLPFLAPLFLLLWALPGPAGFCANLTELEQAYQTKDWPRVAEKAHEILKDDSNATQARLRGAEAVQQLGYPIAALIFLQGVGKAGWKAAPNGADVLNRNIEFYKDKVPATTLAFILANDSDSELAHWISARAAYENKDRELARTLLNKIPDTSAFAAQAHYLLGALALSNNTLKSAETEFAKACTLESNKGVGCLAKARMLYARSEDKQASDSYSQIQRSSDAYTRANLEKTWLDLRNNRPASDSDLPKDLDGLLARAAVELNEGDFTSAESTLNKLLRHHGEESKKLEDFARSVAGSTTLPTDLLVRLDSNTAWTENAKFQTDLEKEIGSLSRFTDERYPFYSHLAHSLAPIQTETNSRLSAISKEFAQNQTDQMEKVYVQAKLFLADAYLRHSGRGDAAAHEQALEKASHELEEASKSVQHFYPSLSLRSSELLWELGRTKEKDYQTSKNSDDREKSILLKQRALEFVDTLMSQVTQFSKMDRALFFAGYVELEMGKEAVGEGHLNQFILSYPKEPAVAEAHRILADYYFGKLKYDEARSEYQKVLTAPKSPLVGYAHYKIGWCNYYLGNSNAALSELESSVQWTNQWEKSDDVVNLEKQAKHDLISIYAESADFHDAATFFSRFLGNESDEWLNQLGDHLEQTGQNDRAAELYRSLISAFPESPHNLHYQVRELKALYAARNWKKIPATAKELVERYRGQLRNASDKETIAAEQTLRTVVLADIQQLADNAPAEDIKRPLLLDENYLSAFQEWQSAEKPLFEKGRLLIRLRQWDLAAPLLRDHWTRFQASLDADSRELALRALISTLEQIEVNRPSNAGAANGIGLEILQLSDEYQRSYPNSKYIREITFFASSLWFRFNDLDKGLSASQRVFDFNPRDDFGKKAFDNLRVGYYKTKNWEKIYHWSTEMGSRKLPGMEMYQEPLTTIRGESLFMLATETKDDHTAAELFTKESNDPDLSEYWVKALYNAFLRYRAANEKQKALKTAIRLETLAPDSEWIRNIAPARAEIYESAGDYESALPFLNYVVFNPPRDISNENKLLVKLKLALALEAIGRARSAVPLLREYLTSAVRNGNGVVQAELAMDRMNISDRAPSSVDKRWSVLEERFATYERNPLPPSGSPEKRIQYGGQQLQALAEESLAISNNNKSPVDTALEAYCAIPFLYQSYSNAINDTASNLTGPAQDKLARIASGLVSKTKELALQCIAKSNLVEHDGPFYRRVNGKWGWTFDPILNERVNRLIQALQTVYPALDPTSEKDDELKLIDDHLAGHESQSTWFALSRIRCAGQTDALCRLTLEQALGKYPMYGPLLNALALLQERLPKHEKISNILERAGHQGSTTALANLALYHFKGERLHQGTDALKQASEAGEFEPYESLKATVKEWIK